MTVEQQHILKERLKELIGGRKVVAALFYTFNFDPKFFENYVMPLLVPGQTFINNSITNNILWRKLYKDNLVPPIAVYFDQDAKSTDNGPFLDYQLMPVNMPMRGKNKGNFHPKNSFILIENPEDRTNELIVITGSNNITQNGWCENVECIGEQTLIAGREFPYNFRLDIKKFVADTQSDFGLSEYTTAERLIDGYLNKIKSTKDREIYFYNSYQYSFQQMLDEFVLVDESIKTAEIISPYFAKKPELLSGFINNSIEVRIQAPIKDGFCLLDKEVYNTYKSAGIKWCYPLDIQRSNHSKVYRFYGSEKTYTIVGSVNLTEPAWRGYEERSKLIYNIESAILYIEKLGKPGYLFKKEIKNDELKFIEPAATEENRFERVEIPDITFTINWLEKTLKWKSKVKNPCSLDLAGSFSISIKGNDSVTLSDLKNGNSVLDAIARRPVLKVTEDKDGRSVTHFYYLNQIGFEARPLQFRLSATDILDAWDLLGGQDEELQEWLVTRLELANSSMQDESGKLLSDKTENKSLLNEMARHFYGLVKLEEFLFDESVYRKNQNIQSAHVNNLKYYLTYDNVDTLYSYFKDLTKLHDTGNIMSVYYWLLLNIIITGFYGKKEIMKMFRNLYSDNWNLSEIKLSIENTRTEIEMELKKTEKTFSLDKKQMKWALSVLHKQHGIS